MDRADEFVVQESEQYFDEQEQQFLADRYIMGTCPSCAFEKAYGDQCEQCGTSLNPEDLIDPVSRLSGNAPVKKNDQTLVSAAQQVSENLPGSVDRDQKKPLARKCLGAVQELA